MGPAPGRAVKVSVSQPGPSGLKEIQPALTCGLGRAKGETAGSRAVPRQHNFKVSE